MHLCTSGLLCLSRHHVRTGVSPRIIVEGAFRERPLHCRFLTRVSMQPAYSLLRYSPSHKPFTLSQCFKKQVVRRHHPDRLEMGVHSPHLLSHASNVDPVGGALSGKRKNLQCANNPFTAVKQWIIGFSPQPANSNNFCE